MQEFWPEVSEPRFDTEAQKAIIARAAELQRLEASSLSRSEIEAAAAEAGIDPRFVRTAISSLRQQPRVEGAERFWSKQPSRELWPVGIFAGINFLFTYEVLCNSITWAKLDSLHVPALMAVATGLLIRRTRKALLLACAAAAVPSLIVISFYLVQGLLGSINGLRYEDAFDSVAHLVMWVVAGHMLRYVIVAAKHKLVKEAPRPINFRATTPQE